MTQAQVYNLLMACLPDPQFVKYLSFARTGETSTIQFDLIGKIFRVNCETLSVQKIEGDSVCSDNECSLLSQLLKTQKVLSSAQK